MQGRYYFHIASSDEEIPDYEGVRLASLDACHDHALRIIRECIPYVQSDPRRWWITVADQGGVSRLVVLYPRYVPFGTRRQVLDQSCDARYWAEFLMRVCVGGARPTRPAG